MFSLVSIPLVNEIASPTVKVEEQGTSIAQLKKQIEALTATVQKVSDQLELNRRAPQLVADDQ